MNHLRNNFYTMPRYANTTMTTKELKETLLATDGQILACGYLFEIKNKKIGPGVYRVYLERWEWIK